MNTNILVVINIIILLAVIFGLVLLKKKRVSFTIRVILALTIGIIFGTILQLKYGASSDVVKQSNSWFSVIGTGYVRLLSMIVIPLIFISITSAIINQDSKKLGKMAATFLIKLILVTTLSSFGIAGVGGGATFASLIVLPAMGLPVGLVGLLIAIEPLIDMARTLVNVSDSMITGLISSKLMGELNLDVYNSKIKIEG
ncbi:L-cystine uptake protein TcyP (sodium:dicarboxylate symporter family) [Sedimentibacter acidaminivorans]|uniref:L-cystine uptake protein TcyP n=1 Tax=Sedimentibacter acidaminivorans TaxID=913099 RepID=A0ABS4GBY5_9FIRM|nr:cation:dicarboxylase symporter family transporter [Sedimentibacter acidaminivorans]MBP1925208.1 L-cystine uptake protein TcyP (sodium:dicarboxylate symporter family) [Sedimentibacter acidaminivorans]